MSASWLCCCYCCVGKKLLPDNALEPNRFGMRYSPIAERHVNPHDSPLQSGIEALSELLGRPTLLDDPELVPLAYSRQWGELDPVRTQSILGRGAPSDVRRALFAQGIAERAGVFLTEPAPELGMAARICRTLRNEGEVLGFLWLIPGDQELSSSESDQVEAAAQQLEDALFDSDSVLEGDETRLLELLRGPDCSERDVAGAKLAARGMGPETPIIVCLVSVPPGGPLPVETMIAASRRLTVGLAIAGRSSEGGTLIASPTDPALSSVSQSEIAEWLRTGSAPGSAVGQSEVLSLDRLPIAFHQASTSLKVARSAPGGSAAAWERLGADRLIAQLPLSSIHDFPEGLTHVIEHEPDLAQTLKAFLDNAGHVKETSERLALHRSGLYYRLARIEDLTGLDLDSGDDRLLAHLALRTRHLF
jgi:hypothetical protein